jgi:hypothetical protein
MFAERLGAGVWAQSDRAGSHDRIRTRLRANVCRQIMDVYLSLGVRAL